MRSNSASVNSTASRMLTPLTGDLLMSSFALNADELKVLKREMDKDDFAGVYKAITGSTDESLGQIQTDIDKLLGEEEEKKEEKKTEDTNPFSALLKSNLFE